MTEREQLPDTTAAWTIYQSSGGGGDEFYCLNNTVQSGTRPEGLTSTDGITSERYGNTVYCRAPGIAPPTGKVPFEFTVERNGANNDATLVAACELNPVIDGSRPSDYSHEVWFQSDTNVIRCFGYGTPPPPPDLYAVGDPGHIQAHADLVASVNEELARFGLDDPLPIKEEGDEAHLDDHNAIRAKLELLETTAAQTFTHGLPPVRSLGDPAHTDDHNMLAWAVSEVKGWAAWNDATGGTITTVEDGEYPLEGRWRVHTFTGNGTLDVKLGVQPFRVLCVAGGGGGAGGVGNNAQGGVGGSGGAGGVLEMSSVAMDVGEHSVTVGNGGGGVTGDNNPGTAGKGGTSSLEGVVSTTGGGGGSKHPSSSGGSGGSGGGGCSFVGNWGGPSGGGGGILGQGTNGNGGGSQGVGPAAGGRAGNGLSVAYQGGGRTSDITGTSRTYAPGSGYGGGGNGRGWEGGGSAGQKGVVIVAYRIG